VPGLRVPVRGGEAAGALVARVALPRNARRGERRRHITTAWARFTTQLIAASTDRHLLAETYARDLRDILALLWLLRTPCEGKFAVLRDTLIVPPPARVRRETWCGTSGRCGMSRKVRFAPKDGSPGGLGRVRVG
jgi:hypothetical protein